MEEDNIGNVKIEETYEKEVGEGPTIRFVNIIFLPFQPIFKFCILITVITKCIMGPMASVHSFDQCDRDTLQDNKYTVIENYKYFSDIVYMVDIFLHLLHRQVEDEARKREYLPKAAIPLLVDLISVIPFYKMISGESCTPPRLWPDVLAFSETLVIYRVVDYFSLKNVHSMLTFVTGFSITFFLVVNAITCFLLLLTLHGLCDSCTRMTAYDWRRPMSYRNPDIFNSTSLTYMYGFQYVLGHTTFYITDQLFPKTMINFFFTVFLMFVSYVFWTFLFVPRLFNDALLHIRCLSMYSTRAKRMISETAIRNTSPEAHVNVETFYSTMWDKQRGIISIPKIIHYIPRYLKLGIIQDLSWAVFYHSPTFRKTSLPYKRWLCEHIMLEYRLPGERLFSGLHCYTKLYYLKSGVVQFFAMDDTSAAMLSVSGGTIFGDVSAIIPPINRKVTVRCLTYCEVFTVTRAVILISLHKFPNDRRNILQLVRNRMKHARDLFYCKQEIRGTDVVVDEGIDWIKKRWWLVANAVAAYKRSNKRKQCEMPREETNYHCVKYIGQLVLCKENQLRRESMFSRDKFPWLLSLKSKFITVWNTIVCAVAWITLFVLPPAIVRMATDKPVWIPFFLKTVDFIYAVDIIVLLFSATEGGQNISETIFAALIRRCKDIYFILDLFATAWVDYFMAGTNQWSLSDIVKFNRLLKTHILFQTRRDIKWTRHTEIKYRMYLYMLVVHCLILYASGFFIYMMSIFIPDMTQGNYFRRHCLVSNTTNCLFREYGILSLSLIYMYTLKVESGILVAKTKLDSSFDIVGSFILFVVAFYTQSYCMSIFYVKYKLTIDYCYYVTILKSYYNMYNLHPKLMKRLDSYLECHWKYIKGADVLMPKQLNEEPYNIYWNVHGEVAEKIIRESDLFKESDPVFIRELAKLSQFLILPRNIKFIKFGVLVKQINWLVKGSMKCEYRNNLSEIVQTIVPKGTVLSVTSVLLGGASIRTYTTDKECEILFLPHKFFIDCLKRFPAEAAYFETCVKEFSPMYNELIQAYLHKHREDLKKLSYATSRSSSFHSYIGVVKERVIPTSFKNNIFIRLYKEYRTNPESRFVVTWMYIRGFIALVSILYHCLASITSGSKAFELFCRVTGYLDMIIKLFMPYYHKNGLVISNIWKCIMRYITGSLLLDIIINTGLPASFYQFFNNYYIDMTSIVLVTISISFAQLYILIGIFDYLSDTTRVNFALITVVKLHVIIFLLLLYISIFFMARCVDLRYGATVLNKLKKATCWMPNYYLLNDTLETYEVDLIYTLAFSLTQNMLMIRASSIWTIAEHDVLYYTVTYVTLGGAYWVFYNLGKALLILNLRTNVTFHNGVFQLKAFLKSERVPKELLTRAIDYFDYYWIRTKGLNVDAIMSNRVGVVFREELCYFFNKKTLEIAASLLDGGKSLQGQFANLAVDVYFLDNQDIMREMDLTPNVFIVNRGKVNITKEGKILASLTKGSIFGQLHGNSIRPTRVTATAAGHTDVLMLKITDFQQLIEHNTEVNNKICAHPESKNDYLSTAKPVKEVAQETIAYMLRGSHVIKIPKIRRIIQAENSLMFSRFLYFNWFIIPTITVALTTMVGVLTKGENIRKRFTAPVPYEMVIMLSIVDVFYVICVIVQIFGVKLVEHENQLVYKYQWKNKFLSILFYIDILSIILPFGVYITKIWLYHFGRLLRMHTILKVYRFHCKSMKNKYLTFIVKTTMLILLIHTLACGWVIVVCRGVPYYKKISVPAEFLVEYDPKWYRHDDTEQIGCMQSTIQYVDANNNTMTGFIFVKTWIADYTLAIYFVICTLVWINSDIVLPITIDGVIYKIIVTALLHVVHLYIGAIAISNTYTKYKEKHKHDYEVNSLLTYLKNNGLSNILYSASKKILRKLWGIQQGSKLPKLTEFAPLCLREDLMESLYIHHLLTPPLFQTFPQYFLRQLATKLNRIVMFPGKSIVQVGDIYPCIFFIHEGEVERWNTDEQSGDCRMTALLTANSYFGLIPGLFPNTPHQFAYYSRTMVDLVYLQFHAWQDLLSGYPELKFQLYRDALHLKGVN